MTDPNNVIYVDPPPEHHHNMDNDLWENQFEKVQDAKNNKKKLEPLLLNWLAYQTRQLKKKLADKHGYFEQLQPVWKYRIEKLRSLGQRIPEPKQEEMVAESRGSDTAKSNEVNDDEDYESDGDFLPTSSCASRKTTRSNRRGITKKGQKNWMDMSQQLEVFMREHPGKTPTPSNGAHRDLALWLSRSKTNLARKIQEGKTLDHNWQQRLDRLSALGIDVLPQVEQTKDTVLHRKGTRKIQGVVSPEASRDRKHRQDLGSISSTLPLYAAGGANTAMRVAPQPKQEQEQEQVQSSRKNHWDFFFNVYKQHGKTERLGEQISRWKLEQKRCVERVLRGETADEEDLERALKVVKLEETFGLFDGEPLVELVQAPSAWSFMFNLLKGFHDEHGHSKVLKGSSGENALLAAWVGLQKARYDNDQWSSEEFTQFIELDKLHVFGWCYEKARINQDHDDKSCGSNNNNNNNNNNEEYTSSSPVGGSGGVDGVSESGICEEAKPDSVQSAATTDTAATSNNKGTENSAEPDTKSPSNTKKKMARSAESHETQDPLMVHPAGQNVFDASAAGIKASDDGRVGCGNISDDDLDDDLPPDLFGQTVGQKSGWGGSVMTPTPSNPTTSEKDAKDAGDGGLEALTTKPSSHVHKRDTTPAKETKTTSHNTVTNATQQRTEATTQAKETEKICHDTAATNPAHQNPGTSNGFASALGAPKDESAEATPKKRRPPEEGRVVVDQEEQKKHKIPRLDVSLGASAGAGKDFG